MTLDRADIEAIAELVAAKVLPELRNETPSRVEWLDAKQLAAKLNVSTGWIYEHAAELGAQRLGTGSKPRLRFNARTAEQAIAGISERPAPVRRRRARTTTSGIPLLPIAGTDSETTSAPQTRGRGPSSTGIEEVAAM